MTCDMLREKFDVYIDANCPPREQEELEEHLRTCPSCAIEALHRMQLKRATKAAAAERFAPSAEFRARMAKSLHAQPRPRFASFWIPSLSLATALLVAVIVSTGWVRHVQRQQELLRRKDVRTFDSRRVTKSSCQLSVVSCQ